MADHVVGDPHWPSSPASGDEQLPGIDCESLTSESCSSDEELPVADEVATDTRGHVQYNAVRDGTLLKSKRKTPIFLSASCQDVVGEVHIFDRVVADGSVMLGAGGIPLVPLKPTGFVELNKFEVLTQKQRRWRLRCSLSWRFKTDWEPLLDWTIFEGVQSRRSFVHVPRLLSPESIEELHALSRHPAARKLHKKGRDADLKYRHVAHRIDIPLRSDFPELYERLIQSMLTVDANLWQKFKPSSIVYPEVEYIVYDARGGIPGTIEPHVDNYAVVSVVILLSDPSDFEGGVNCFDSSGERGTSKRELRLAQGGAVFFRGEKLLHWITPVTAGVRKILQIELSNR